MTDTVARPQPIPHRPAWRAPRGSVIPGRPRNHYHRTGDEPRFP
ncbi:hypothetical protein [Amycolatopsis sp. NPDC051371]